MCTGTHWALEWRGGKPTFVTAPCCVLPPDALGAATIAGYSGA